MSSDHREAESLASADPADLGRRIRDFRLLQNLTQEEAAAKAGVSIKTLFHVEAGKPVRPSSVQKVCVGLGTTVDEFLRRLPKIAPPFREPIVRRASLGEWYAPLDRRRIIPENNASLVQDPKERRRLGKLGFTPVFVCYPTLIMPEGPGMTFIEVYGRFDEGINETIYREAMVYCRKGHVRLGIGEGVVELAEGEVVGCANRDLRWGEPVVEATDDELPALLIWVGAVRLGRVATTDKRTSVRKAKPDR